MAVHITARVWGGLAAVACMLMPLGALAEPRLKAAPQAKGGQITLGDLLEDVGAAGTMALARAPGPGQRVVFSAPVLQARAAGAGVRWRNLEGVRQVVIEGPPAHGASPRNQTSGYQGAAQLATSTPSPVQAQANRAPGAETAPATLAVLSRDVARGEEITANDVVWMDAPDATPRDAITDADALVGKTARRALAASKPLRAPDVMDTPAVRRGQPVTLVFEAGGLKLSVRGRSLADAPIGATIKAINPQSNKTLEAIVEGTGLARVVPASGVGAGSARITASLGTN
jgi:flagellar basal body P-ring formation protein FlgA